MIIIAPIALFFLASFLLTFRWYERAGSVPGLFLGAVLQPLFTASLFASGIVVFAPSFGNNSPSVQSIFSLTFFYTTLVAIPLALIACSGLTSRVRAHESDKQIAVADAGFTTLMVAGMISLACASLALVTLFLIAR